MAYDPELADQVRDALSRLELEPNEHLDAVLMFGGLCFVLNGRILVGVSKERLLVRLGDEAMKDALDAGVAEEMINRGKPMSNFAFLGPSTWETDEELLRWIERSADFVRKFMMNKPLKTRKRPFPKNF